jgi:hypothetical protein
MRFNTATEFARALAAAAAGIAPAREPAAAGPSRPLKVWQRPVFWAIVIAPVVGLLLSVLLWNLAFWGERQVTRLVESLASPRPSTPTPALPQEGAAPIATPAPGVAPTPTSIPTPASSPSPTPISTPAMMTVAEGSPFTNLVLARGIGNDLQPLSPGNDFPASSQPVYLFFDYQGIKPGDRWGHAWIWGDQQLDRSINTWPQDWGIAGTAWVFYTPEGGYQPGPYQVNLLLNDQVVASATFVMR